MKDVFSRCFVFRLLRPAVCGSLFAPRASCSALHVSYSQQILTFVDSFICKGSVRARCIKIFKTVLKTALNDTENSIK